jgi:glycosyltransferase involved in cell wall biosynthesis
MQLMPSTGFYGMERVVYNLSRGLLKEGTGVVIVTSPSLQAKFAELSSATLYILPEHHDEPMKSTHILAEMVIQLRAICSKEEPDIIHVQGTWARVLALASMLNRPTVETLQGVGLAREEAFRRVMIRISDVLAGVYFSGSIYGDLRVTKEYTGLRRRHPNKVIHNSLDEDFQLLARQASDRPISPDYVLWVGRLTAIKGAELLIRAFAKLRRERDFRLVIIGDGPQRGYLESLTNSLGIGTQTIFLGFVDGLEKVRFMQHASVICVNLANPGLSQTLIEAASLGNPVVTHFDKEAEQHLGGQVIFLGQTSTEELAVALEDALNKRAETHIPTAVMSEFSQESFIRQYLEFYSRLLDDAKASKQPEFLVRPYASSTFPLDGEVAARS